MLTMNAEPEAAPKRARLPILCDMPDAYRERVLDSMARLRAGETQREVWELHGRFVLQDAVRLMEPM